MDWTLAAPTADDVATIEQMELEFAEEVPECERDRCEGIAVNLIVHRCCGHMYALCAQHTEELQGLLNRAEALGGMHCRLCHQQPVPNPSILPYHR